jgi:hypothetical protein
MQLDLFRAPDPPRLSTKDVREKEHFGTWDCRCGLPLRNGYSTRLTPEQFAVYELAYREELARHD